MTKRKPLKWYETGRSQIPLCDECSDWMMQPHMVEGVASVGIEKPAGVDVRQMVDQYHANRHRED